MSVWHQKVDSAESSGEVLGIARDFLTSLTPDDLASVPDDCRPGPIRDQSDIDFWNLRLAEELRAIWGTNRDGHMVTELAQFFLHASVRLSRLGDAPPHYAYNVH
jgi:hypothetical protein